MLEGFIIPDISEVLFPLCLAVGYVAIIGSVSAMVVKLVRWRGQRSEMGLLATAECKITLLCCSTFMLMGILIVVFFNSI